MLDNLSYLVTDTVLSWYLIILIAQIILLWFAKRKNSKILWFVLFAVIIGSIVLSCVAVVVFGSAPGIGHLADAILSIVASVVYPAMLWIASLIKNR